ncbi:MAG: ACT domain-containing protein [Rhodospirillales bacterium]|nr:ACT domain-containing protein [Rhodospirillales bacterium]
MTSNALVSVICQDHTGLVADVAGLLFDLNINLGDTTFAVLGEAAELTCLAEVPDDLSLDRVSDEIEKLLVMDDAQVSVTPFEMAPIHDESAHITHRIELDGRDRPGVIARLAEVFGQHGANIVRMNCERVPEKGHDRYVTRFSLYIPERRVESCLATVANTAGEMQMSFEYIAVDD